MRISDFPLENQIALAVAKARIQPFLTGQAMKRMWGQMYTPTDEEMYDRVKERIASGLDPTRRDSFLKAFL